MPIFNRHKVVYIHVPKTGGSSLIRYFGECVTAWSPYAMISHNDGRAMKHMGIAHSLQHCTYLELVQLGLIDKLVDKGGYRLIATFRDPFERIISELIYSKMVVRKILESENHSDAYHKLLAAFRTSQKQRREAPFSHDNHLRSQCEFLTDGETTPAQGLVLLRTGSLSQDMYRHGWKNFNVHMNVTVARKAAYERFRTGKLLQEIKEAYSDDFELQDRIDSDCARWP